MTLRDIHGVRQIESSSEVKLLGVTIDETMTFRSHSQKAASKALQVLGSIRFLRAGRYGISPLIARHLIISKVIPVLIWGSPIWWIGTPTVKERVENTYYMMARWITGLPMSTRITKLLYCAHLPPIDLWLDLITTNYAIRLISLPESHNLRPLPHISKIDPAL
jgi:hypothetical protein